MKPQSWREYRSWHELFDALCNGRGWHDNSDLASEFCKHSGKTTQEDFNAAKRKLRDWRSGRRTARRQNFAILSDLLGTKNDPELSRHWHTLYRSSIANAVSAYSAVPAVTGWRMRRTVWLAASFSSGLAIAMMVVGLQYLSFNRLPEVEYNSLVQLKLGESLLVHGEMTQCSDPAPDWADISPTLPTSALGAFSDGGIARKTFTDCENQVRVRAVRFTGTKTGVEEIDLFRDFIKIVVVEP